MPSSAVAVVNPASANGRTGRRWSEMVGWIEAALGEPPQVFFTERAGHASDLTRAALAAGAGRIIAVGGDGTFNEVVSGFFAGREPIRPGAALSLIPAGTGGDLRRSLGLGLDQRQAAALIGRHDRRVDVGRLSFIDHDGGESLCHFINIASFGMGGLVDRFVNQSSKRLGGRVSFLLGVARAALRYSNQPVRIRLDDGPPVERVINNVAVANGRFFGGGMCIAPEADLSDGLFDVVSVGDLGTLAMVRGLPRIYSGRHIGMEGVVHTRAHKVFAEPARADQEVLLDVDGEQPGRLPATFEIVPSALSLGFGA